MPIRFTSSVSITLPFLSLPPPSVQFFLFCSVVFPQFFQLFHCYLRIMTGENSASSCFGCTADKLPLGRTGNLFFKFCWEKNEPSGRLDSIMKAKLYREPIYIHIVSVYVQPLHVQQSVITCPLAI